MADFGAIKAQARQTVHDVLSVPALYSFNGGASVPLTVTHRDRNARHGDNGGEYAGVLEGVDRIKFNRPQIDAAGITLQRAGLVTIPSEGYTYALDQEEPALGSINIYWSVVRQL